MSFDILFRVSKCVIMKDTEFGYSDMIGVVLGPESKKFMETPEEYMNTIDFTKVYAESLLYLEMGANSPSQRSNLLYVVDPSQKRSDSGSYDRTFSLHNLDFSRIDINLFPRFISKALFFICRILAVGYGRDEYENYISELNLESYIPPLKPNYFKYYFYSKGFNSELFHFPIIWCIEKPKILLGNQNSDNMSISKVIKEWSFENSSSSFR